MRRPRGFAGVGPRRPAEVIAKLLLIVLGGYAALVGFVFVSQHRLVYLPDAAGGFGPLTPADLGLEYENVRIPTPDGLSLHGWLVHGAGPRVVLFFHGNAGNVSHRLETIRLFSELGLTVLIIDYRGYGRSEGTPSEAGTYADAEAAWRYLTQERRVAPGEIVVFGRSLGGPIAAQLALRQAPAGLVVESAFTSVTDLASEIYWFLPVRWMSRFRYPTEEFLRDVECPVLIIHGRDDEIVPFAHAKALYAAANEPRTLLELPGGHNDATLRIRHGAYREGLEQFLRSLDNG